MNPQLHGQTVMIDQATMLAAAERLRLAAEVRRATARRAAVVRARARLADAVGRQAAARGPAPVGAAALAP